MLELRERRCGRRGSVAWRSDRIASTFRVGLLAKRQLSVSSQLTVPAPQWLVLRVGIDQAGGVRESPRISAPSRSVTVDQVQVV
ncbi:hypothetical protein [Phytohabitans houttuyneae]|uniref:hypothetical protein n=1 Tax=Phytohabitans houttuyneae TaxID=1076126 RepID=UPI0015648144|nr:hypothetical protein [Phytohabitans houttuyneae]